MIDQSHNFVLFLLYHMMWSRYDIACVSCIFQGSVAACSNIISKLARFCINLGNRWVLLISLSYCKQMKQGVALQLAGILFSGHLRDDG